MAGNAATLADFLRERDHDENRSVLQTEPSVSDLLHDVHAHARATSPDETPDPPPRQPTAETLPTMRILRHLQRVDEALLALARPLGLPPAAESTADDPVSQRVPYPV